MYWLPYIHNPVGAYTGGDVSFIALTENLGWAAYFKQCLVKLLVNKFAGDVFAPDAKNEVL
jgi:hypothetical protein